MVMVMKKVFNPIRKLALATSLVVAPGLAGAESLVDKSYSPGDFRAISSGLPATIQVRIGDKPAVTVRAADSVISRIGVSVVDQMLSIEARESFQTSSAIEIQVTTPSLKALNLDGAVSLELKGLKGSELALTAGGSASVALHQLNLGQLSGDLSESSSVEVTGTVGNQQISVSDAASYEAEELQTESAQIEVEGSGEAVMNVARQLSVKVSDAGSVEYLGDPAVNQQIEDAGSLEQR